jgi:hypothetical protein
VLQTHLPAFVTKKRYFTCAVLRNLVVLQTQVPIFVAESSKKE